MILKDKFGNPIKFNAKAILKALKGFCQEIHSDAEYSLIVENDTIKIKTPDETIPRGLREWDYNSAKERELAVKFFMRCCEENK